MLFVGTGKETAVVTITGENDEGMERLYTITGKTLTSPKNVPESLLRKLPEGAESPQKQPKSTLKKKRSESADLDSIFNPSKRNSARIARFEEGTAGGDHNTKRGGHNTTAAGHTKLHRGYNIILLLYMYDRTCA